MHNAQCTMHNQLVRIFSWRGFAIRAFRCYIGFVIRCFLKLGFVIL